MPREVAGSASWTDAQRGFFFRSLRAGDTAATQIDELAKAVRALLADALRAEAAVPEQHAGIFDREAVNQEAEAGRAQAEASSADARAATLNASENVEAGIGRSAQ